jgi:hypothetical protein
MIIVSVNAKVTLFIVAACLLLEILRIGLGSVGCYCNCMR